MLRLSRRALLLGGLGLVAGSLLRGGRIAGAEDRPALPIPAELRADAAGAIRLTVQAGQRRFVPAGPTPTFGINGDYLGPAIRVKRGDKVAITVANTLGEDTTMHWHGLAIPGREDGGPHNPIKPGASWTANLAIDQPATTCWFHPHNYPSTAEQVLKGLAGLFVIEDEESTGLGLPSRWGIDDIPLILQDRRFNPNGSFFHRFNLVAVTTGYIGDRLLVNGASYPVARTARGWLRLRLLNGSNARSYRIAAADGRALHVIASDGGFLAEPVTLEALQIAAGERYEVLVDARDGKAFDLVTLPVMTQIGMTLPPFHEALTFVTLSPEGAEGEGRLPDALASLPPLDPALPALSQELVVGMRLDDQGMALLAEAGLGMPSMEGMAGMDHAAMGHGAMDMPGMAMTPNPDVVERMTRLIVEGPALSLAQQLAANEINGKCFEIGETPFAAPLGRNLRWAVSEGTDQMFHPIHIHGCQFRILSLAGKSPPAEMAGWKDTVPIDKGGRAEIQIRFDHPAADSGPYMAHCHILEHEDSGMMLQFAVA